MCVSGSRLNRSSRESLATVIGWKSKSRLPIFKLELYSNDPITFLTMHFVLIVADVKQ